MEYYNNYKPTQLRRTPKEKGLSLEEDLRRLTENKEPISQDVPPIYTPYKDGVIGDYDIRKDRFDVAYEAADKFSASNEAKSEEIAKYEPKEETKTENTSEQ